MNESIPPIPASYKNRFGGLIAFGIVLILLGCVCALFVPLIIWAQNAAQKMNTSANGLIMLFAVLLYGGLAAALIWLGIGSILARRWARALILILAWFWLLIGVVSLGVMAWIMPQILAHPQPGTPAMPAAVQMVAVISAMIFMSLIFVLLPGGLVLFYRSRHVKATCEARDPVPRWTDACPLPVLALSLLLAFGAVTMLVLPLCCNSVIPFFGRFLSGLPGTIFLVPVIAWWSYCAWAIYRLKPLGWTLTVAGMIVLTVSTIITYTRVDIMEMYRLTNCYSEEQIQYMRQTGFINSRTMLIFMIGSWVPFFGYLWYVKKFFRRLN